jgi:hypothetical protein
MAILLDTSSHLIYRVTPVWITRRANYFSTISYKLSTILRRVYDKLTNPATMAKRVKITKMASNDNPHPTVLGSEGSVHINLHKEVLTGFEEGMKVFKGTYYRQVKLVQATELDLAVAQEQVKALVK